MRKAFFSVLMGCAILCSACAGVQAEDLSRVREQAADGWRRVYESHGRTIAVDVQPVLPDADGMSIVTARYHPPFDPSLYEKYNGEPNAEALSWAGFISVTHNDPLAAWSDRSGDDIGWHETQLAMEDIDENLPFLENNPITMQEILEVMQEGMAHFGIAPDAFDTARPSFMVARRLRKSSGRDEEGSMRYDGEPVLDMAMCHLRFRQQFRGVPLLEDAISGFNHLTNLHRVPFISMYGGIDIKSVDSFHFYAVVAEETALIEENVSLCAFEDIIRAYEPLIADGYIREVHSMELGLVGFHDPEDQDLFWMIPTWMIDTEFYPSASMERPAIFGEGPVSLQKVLVNAQTGTLINPLDDWQKSAMRPEALVR